MTICKGIKKDNTSCTFNAKYNGFCGFHKSQFQHEPDTDFKIVNNQKKIINIPIEEKIISSDPEIKQIIINKNNTCIIFKTYLSKFKNIVVNKNIHTDLNLSDNSLHFNCVFVRLDGSQTREHHAYIKDGIIVRLTKITDILKNYDEINLFKKLIKTNLKK